MKELNFLAAFIGGAAVGLMAGILLAPDKGSETRKRIAEYLDSKGIHLNKEEFEKLVREVTGRFKGHDSQAEEIREESEGTR